MTTKYSAEDIERATEILRTAYPKGSTVYTVLRHVSQSGMTRAISIIAADDKREISDLSWAMLRLGYKFDSNHGGLKVSGGGMDMGFHLTYSLAGKLYGDGYALNHRWV